MGGTKEGGGLSKGNFKKSEVSSQEERRLGASENRVAWMICNQPGVGKKSFPRLWGDGRYSKKFPLLSCGEDIICMTSFLGPWRQPSRHPPERRLGSGMNEVTLETADKRAKGKKITWCVVGASVPVGGRKKRLKLCRREKGGFRGGTRRKRRAESSQRNRLTQSNSTKTKKRGEYRSLLFKGLARSFKEETERGRRFQKKTKGNVLFLRWPLLPHTRRKPHQTTAEKKNRDSRDKQRGHRILGKNERKKKMQRSEEGGKLEKRPAADLLEPESANTTRRRRDKEETNKLWRYREGKINFGCPKKEPRKERKKEQGHPTAARWPLSRERFHRSKTNKNIRRRPGKRSSTCGEWEKKAYGGGYLITGEACNWLNEKKDTEKTKECCDRG